MLENFEKDLDAELVEEATVATPSGGVRRAAGLDVGELSHLEGVLALRLLIARCEGADRL
jgi:hypothetical protein